ncbi:MAG: arginase, partial [Flavobacteriaceae bacterium]|nr:arginase [Flavobacteriaceae bacterium]
MNEFLSPVSKSVCAHREVLAEGTLGKQMRLHSESNGLPDLSGVKLAFIGVQENRNDVNYLGEDLTFDILRKNLYSLYPGNWSHRMVDLGDIEKGATVKDSYFAV